MKDDGSQSPPVSGRNQEFGGGMIGGQVSAPPSMQEMAARYNASVPTSYHPSGSPNGMGMAQYQQTLGGAFGAPNGISIDSYETKRYFQGGPR